jgi:hypothetical protein
VIIESGASLNPRISTVLHDIQGIEIVFVKFGYKNSK